MQSRIFRTSKINEFRLWGLILILAGMGVMVLGTAAIVLWGFRGRLFTSIFIVLGLISLLGSSVIYFWAGLLSTSAVVLQCPECERETKLLGKTDRCMFCRSILTLDPNKATHL